MQNADCIHVAGWIQIVGRGQVECRLIADFRMNVDSRLCVDLWLDADFRLHVD